ncbi:MAG: helix-turn-helix domain-containing protein, partial [Xanthobacteraceae bacterium]
MASATPPFRYDEIGDRLRAFRLGSGLSADEIARRLGISRTALYRFEKGELAKIETLERLAEMLNVSIPTLLGVGIEYVPSAVVYFERMRQIEETADHISVLAGPISSLLASDKFEGILEQVLKESLAASGSNNERALSDIPKIIAILHERKEAFRRRRPGIVNLISASEIGRFLRDGFVGTASLPESVARERRLLARAEIEHFAKIIEEQPIGTQIGIVIDTLPHSGFHIYRQPDRSVLVLSPFRLGEQPNIHVGVAMITSAPEALLLHQNLVEDVWRRAVKGNAASAYLGA